MDIKEPAFDKPIGLGATGERRVVDATAVEITEGMRVMVVYQGKNMTAEVTAVEKPNSQFVARVLDFNRHELEHGDLKHGDLFRFSRDDLRWIG
jgi:hypothetical protein